MPNQEEIAAPLDVLRPEAATEKPILDRRYVVAALMLVMVLASMEQTVTSTAMPTIIGDLHGLEHYSWVASIYLLACTVSVPLYGRLADVLGRKKVVLTAIGLFCVASVLPSAARTMGQLILFRALQGLGAGGVMPVVLTIIGDIFTLEERARIQGVFSAVWGAAALAGPALGAFLVSAFGWRSVFYVNLPFGALGFAVLAWKYHDRAKPHSTELDLPGITLLAVASTALPALVSGLTVVSFSGLLACAVLDAPRSVLTAVLLLSGLGFGPASMAYILAAQNAVTWQQRGIITSGIQFFRTIGGAVGIGVLGMVF